MGGGGGMHGVRGVVRDFRQSGNPILQNAGEWIKKHPKTALVGSIGIGGTAFGAGMSAGENLIKKPLESIDKNAFAYSKSKEQPVEPIQNSSY
jgi:hypothetical protein